MTKKVVSLLAIFAVAGTLAACNNTKPTEEKSMCESYISYFQCASEKQGMDDATVKAGADQLRAGIEQYPEDQRELMCSESIKTLKTQPLVEGCELPEVSEVSKDDESDVDTGSTSEVEVATGDAADEVNVEVTTGDNNTGATVEVEEVVAE